MPETQVVDPEDRIARLDVALDAAPLDIALHQQMLDALRAAGDTSGFAAHQLALAAFAVLGDAPGEQAALVLYNIATVYAIKGRRSAAIRWYRHALGVAPDLAIAHQNLAVALEEEGQQQEALAHRDRAYRLQRVFVEPAHASAERRLLVLGVGKGTGNTPLDALVQATTTCRINYALDYADVAEDAQLPPHDLVFNAIGDPDIAAPLAERLDQFAQQCERPLLNAPAAIARTGRQQTAARLAGLDAVIVPACLRLDARPASADLLARRLARAGITFPMLMRPLATHGGAGLELHASLATLWSALVKLDAPCYLSAYRDTRNADGHYRKYRIIYVDREPYPYHLAISRHWMVHYFSADMTIEPWKLDEERRFLADPQRVLGERAMQAIVDIGQRLDLDYGGIDFTLTASGEVLVFEANATMLVHREARNGPLAHKNPAIECIVAAFERMQRTRAAR